MTKEIINGVDVSGCGYYWNTKGLELCKINFDNNYYSNGLPLAEKCSEHINCYYKQLKRLEQENAKLKEENFKLDFKLGQIDIKKITLVENRQLAEENERLKTCLEMIKNTEGQAHIKGMEMAKKLEKIKDIVVQNYGCKCVLEELMNVFVEGAEDDD